jgi:hypothetical protein
MLAHAVCQALYSKIIVQFLHFTTGVHTRIPRIGKEEKDGGVVLLVRQLRFVHRVVNIIAAQHTAHNWSWFGGIMDSFHSALRHLALMQEHHYFPGNVHICAADWREQTHFCRRRVSAPSDESCCLFARWSPPWTHARVSSLRVQFKTTKRCDHYKYTGRFQRDA